MPGRFNSRLALAAVLLTTVVLAGSSETAHQPSEVVPEDNHAVLPESAGEEDVKVKTSQPPADGVEQLVEESVNTAAATGSADPLAHEPTPLINRLMHPEDDVDKRNGGKNSLGLDRLVGGKKYRTKHDKNGRLKPPGYTTQDSYVGPNGHLYLGPSRRRIGSGFGLRRRRTPAPPPPAVPPHIKKMHDGCLAAAKDEKTEGGLEKDLHQTMVHGTVVDLHTGFAIEGVEVTWTDFMTGKQLAGGPVKTDPEGKYSINVGRCAMFTSTYVKDGYVKVNGQCAGEPLILWKSEVYLAEGMTKNLRSDELMFSLTWERNDKYLKDLDLHLLIPGERHVLLQNYTHLDTRGHPKVKVKDVLWANQANKKGAKKEDFNGTDISTHEDWLDHPLHIFWDNEGHEHHYPFATFDIDHGSAAGSHDTGGPESIHIVKGLNKQYLAWVDCWSCDEVEDEWDGDKQIPLTAASLAEFAYESRATIKVYQGTEQLSCSAVWPKMHQPVTTRWDASMIQCPGEGGGKCTDIAGIGFNLAYPGADKHVYPAWLSDLSGYDLSGYGVTATSPVTAPEIKHFAGCYDSRHRDKLGWIWPDKARVKDLGEAREKCRGFKFVALECPTAAGAEVWCIPDLGDSRKLPDSECRGDPVDVKLGGNKHCVGPYSGGGAEGGWGGAHRAAVYSETLPPPEPEVEKLQDQAAHVAHVEEHEAEVHAEHEEHVEREEEQATSTGSGGGSAQTLTQSGKRFWDGEVENVHS